MLARQQASVSFEATLQVRNKLLSAYKEFIGAVITVQIKLNISNPLLPRWTVGYVTREIMLIGIFLLHHVSDIGG